MKIYSTCTQTRTNLNSSYNFAMILTISYGHGRLKWDIAGMWPEANLMRTCMSIKIVEHHNLTNTIPSKNPYSYLHGHSSRNQFHGQSHVYSQDHPSTREVLQGCQGYILHSAEQSFCVTLTRDVPKSSSKTLNQLYLLFPWEIWQCPKQYDL